MSKLDARVSFRPIDVTVAKTALSPAYKAGGICAIFHGLEMTNPNRLLGIALAAVTTIAAGAYAVGTEHDRICAKGAAEAGRPSPDAWLKLRQQVFARAGVSFPAHHSEYEVDHIVPRCLGGSNELDNLQLQRWATARVKDLLEAETCREYCAGRISLTEARGRFRRDR